MEVEGSIVPTAIILTGGFVLNLGLRGGPSLGYVVLPPSELRSPVYPNAAAITGNVLRGPSELPDRVNPSTADTEWATYNAENH